jgi:hypothetical protein
MSDKCPARKEKAQGRTARLDPVSEQSDNDGSASEAESSDSPN